MATELRGSSKPPAVVIVPAGPDEDILIGQVEVNNGVLSVKIDPAVNNADCSSGPGVCLALDYDNDGCAVVLDYLDLDEENCVALIKALTEALEIERSRARERGYYDWVAAGEPDYYTDPEHRFFREDDPAGEQ